MITGFHIRINYEKYTLFRYFITCLLQYTVIYGTRHSDRAFNYHIYTIVLKINNNKIFITISSKSTAKDSLADFSSLYREYSSMKWNGESLYAMIFEKKTDNKFWTHNSTHENKEKYQRMSWCEKKNRIRVKNLNNKKFDTFVGRY